MDWSSKVSAFLGDDRLLANLIAVHAVLGILLVLSVVCRWLLQNGGERFLAWIGAKWLNGITREATSTARNLIYWVTLLLMGVSVAAGIVYHVIGRDVRKDGVDLWQNHLTPGQVFSLGWTIGKLVALTFGVWLACGFVRQLRRRLEASALTVIPKAIDGTAPADPKALPWDEIKETSVADAAAPTHEQTIRNWFAVLERFALALVVLGGLWLAAIIMQAAPLEAFVHFTIPLVSIVLVARLLTLAGKTICQGLANFGNRHLNPTSYRRYWERVTRLFPFGEKCFESVVYVWAASSIVRDLGLKLPKVELYSDRIIACIGIFFVTRVLIELLHVLLNEAFGMFDESRPIDQKGQTLVPLLHSVVQYVLYFGSGVVMLEVLEGPTQTILAGAGLMGLAVGLGAQSLVGDVVSGFFILFENQYLVGDIVQIGDANGRVEAVGIRHTQIRDEQGKVYFVPNGQIKSVINYSKGFVNAVVDIKVPTSANLDQVMRDMTEAGKKLKATRREVMAETVIKGLVDLSPGDMTVRAVTKVMPGTHSAMQCEYRRLLKEVMDRAQANKIAA